MFRGKSRASMKISSVVVRTIITGFTVVGLEAVALELPTQFATDVLVGDTH